MRHHILFVTMTSVNQEKFAHFTYSLNKLAAQLLPVDVNMKQLTQLVTGSG